MPGKKFLAFVISVAVIFFIQSCKPGCPDKAAFNYSPSAKENDGSCLYCDSTMVVAQTNYSSIEDRNSQSQYEYQYVMRAQLSIVMQQLSGNGCRQLGYNNTFNGNFCTNYSNYLQLINFTSKNITFSGQVFVEYSSKTLTYTFNSAVVPAYDTLKVGNIGNVCDPSTFPFAQISIPNSYTIQYN